MLQFLPANARASSLILADGVLYTSTSGGCGAVPNGVYALDINTEQPKTVTWATGGADVAGASGPTLGTDGTVYVATATLPEDAAAAPASDKTSYASAVVALEPKTLKVKDWFSAPGADFNASPVVFKHKDKDLVVATANDGRLYLLDSAALGGADHRTPLYASAKYTAAGVAAGVATWEDQGTRWILAPVSGPAQADVRFAANGLRPNGGIVAFKLADTGGKIALEPAWASRDMAGAMTPVIFNGVVFAVASGEYRPAGAAKLTAAQRARRAAPAVLYALDPASGKELWTSAKTITSFARAGLAASAGQVYVVTYDNTLYAFGIPMEH
jgi:outer membrane protein assembly factor BamB